MCFGMQGLGFFFVNNSGFGVRACVCVCVGEGGGGEGGGGSFVSAFVFLCFVFKD